MFDWENYLDLAQKLIQQKINIASNEACWRSSISRAYYAVFHKSCVFAYANGFKKPKRVAEEHRKVPIFLIRLGNKRNDLNIKNAGKNLKRLRDNRRKSDYEGQIPNPLNLAKASLIIGDRIFRNIP